MPKDISRKFRKIRQDIYEEVSRLVVEEFPDLDGRIRLTEITMNALDARINNWEQHPDPERQILDDPEDWRTTTDRYKRDHPTRLELAIWYDDTLCGLMLGKPSEGRLVVKINFIEGAFENPLKGMILPIATQCAELFASFIGAPWVGIQDPLDGVRWRYEELGFTLLDQFDPRNNAMYKRIFV
ncbi:MAG: hypothetical protein KJ856_10205 [Gammaproteobacteria bacterium]|nr:hypothetical protein [Gammaproteobacteria bacterium]MBU1479394.1 hypothetical protein [Gammaproteobacteria bacterium]MBU2002102.1 hypothetical protein [Gammaproteobacteria bacterium]MBU2133227.1 hypothetical protein [Gammaproteobacteria bacterium]MBU2187371.1 hypothetical protein [Gammaproteobacteria bacterium]